MKKEQILIRAHGVEFIIITAKQQMSFASNSSSININIFSLDLRKGLKSKLVNKDNHVIQIINTTKKSVTVCFLPMRTYTLLYGKRLQVLLLMVGIEIILDVTIM